MKKDFDDLFTRQFWNLSDVAKKYGFSRERARQIFTKLYDQPYAPIKKIKMLERTEKRKLCSLFFNPRLGKLFSKLDKIGLKSKIISRDKLEINRHIIVFGSKKSTNFGQGIEYILYRFMPFFNFAVLYHSGSESSSSSNSESSSSSSGSHFFIVPAREFSQIGSDGKISLYIRSSAYTDSYRANCGLPHRNISKYKEAWDLLN